MAKQQDKKLIVAVDIGTNKVIVLVAEINEANEINIIGRGQQNSKGIKRGVVVDIESTVASIARAMEEAELMAGCQIHSAYTGIAGSHIRSLNSHGIVAIRDVEVVETDIERVIDAAKAVAIPADQRILHIIPQEFIIDNQEGIKEPVGMSGVRLEARVHIVSGAVSAAQNIIKCMQRCGLEVADIILEQVAASQAVLTEDEKDLGICLVDIGAGTTDIAVFTHGAIKHTAVIPIAGDQVTNDIAVYLRTPTLNAEELKIKHGVVTPELAEKEVKVEIPSVGDRPTREIAKQEIAKVLEARYEELFRLVLAELRRSGFEDLIPAGIVLTGGATKLQGMIELAEKVFNMPVRIGKPTNVSAPKEILNDPQYATVIGLLQYGVQQHYKPRFNQMLMQNGFNGLWSRMRGWFQGNF